MAHMSASREKAFREEQADANRRGNSKTIFNREMMEQTGMKMFTPEADRDNFLAILPPPVPEGGEEGYFGKKIYVHYGIGPDNSSFLCPKEMFDLPCPICNERTRMSREMSDNPSDEERRAVNQLRPTQRYLFFVVNAADPSTIEEGVKLFNAAKSVNSGLITVCTERRTGAVVDITAMEPSTLPNGQVIPPYNFIFKRIGQGMTTRYEAFGKEPREDNIPTEYVENLPYFDELLVTATFDEIKSEFEGMGNGGSSENTSGSDDDLPEPEESDDKTVISGIGRRRRRN